MKIDIAEQFELLPRAPIVEAVIQIHARPETSWEEKKILDCLKPKLSEFEKSFSRNNVKHEVKLGAAQPPQVPRLISYPPQIAFGTRNLEGGARNFKCPASDFVWKV